MKNDENVLKVKRSRLVAYLAIISSVLALLTAITSLFYESVYNDVLEAGTITEFTMHGAIGQDIITIFFSIILITLSILFLQKPTEKVFIMMIGFIGYLVYGYGLFVIEAFYSIFYLVYILIFGLSIYGLIYAFISFKYDEVKKSYLPKKIRKTIAYFLILIISILGPAWIFKVIDGMYKHIPPRTYSVLINDLALVFPAFAITSILLLKNKEFGNILGGIMLIKTFTICFSWGFAQWFVVVFDNPIEYDMAIIATILTFVSSFLIFLFMKNYQSKMVTK